MSFQSFQNDTATLKRMAIDFSGSLTTVESIAIVCDVQMGNKRTLNTDGEQIVVSSTVFVTPNATLDAKSVEQLTKGTWTFTYSGVDYQVESIKRMREPASPRIDHYEVLLR